MGLGAGGLRHGVWCYVLGAGCLVLGSMWLVLGAWCLVLGAMCLVLGAWFYVLCAMCWVLGAGCWVLGAMCYVLCAMCLIYNPCHTRQVIFMRFLSIITLCTQVKMDAVTGGQNTGPAHRKPPLPRGIAKGVEDENDGGGRRTIYGFRLRRVGITVDPGGATRPYHLAIPCVLSRLIKTYRSDAMKLPPSPRLRQTSIVSSTLYRGHFTLRRRGRDRPCGLCA